MSNIQRVNPALLAYKNTIPKNYGDKKSTKSEKPTNGMMQRSMPAKNKQPSSKETDAASRMLKVIDTLNRFKEEVRNG